MVYEPKRIEGLRETIAVAEHNAELADQLGKKLPTISSIKIRGLFGKYNLSEIKIKKSEQVKPSMAFLYGENGIGKTTILRLIFSILAPAPSEGHRTLIGNTKFEEFSILFEDGQSVAVKRPRGKSEGGFSYQFSGPRVNAEIKLSERDLGFSADWPKEKHEKVRKLSECIGAVSPRIIFVNDHRTVKSTHPPWDISASASERVRHSTEGELDLADPDGRTDVDALVGAGLDSLLEATWRHFFDAAFSGNRRASVGTGQIYLDIAKAVAQSGTQASSNRADAYNEFEKRCDAVISYLQMYGRYRIIEADTIPELLNVVDKLSPGQKSQVLFILNPYLASIERRINETISLAKQISAFEKSINLFLFRKRANVGISERIYIKTDENEPLKIRDLSSGERHLLYLCCSSVLSWESPTLMLYDEPELSLNHKWQRKLVDTLTDIASPSTQFIMATHSFEIISQHREFANRLRLVK